MILQYQIFIFKFIGCPFFIKKSYVWLTSSFVRQNITDLIIGAELASLKICYISVSKNLKKRQLFAEPVSAPMEKISKSNFPSLKVY